MEKHAISIDRIILLPTQENTQGLHRSSQNTSMEMLNIMKAWTLNHSCTCFPTRRTSSQDLLIYLCMYMYYIYHTNTRNIKRCNCIYIERETSQFTPLTLRCDSMISFRITAVVIDQIVPLSPQHRAHLLPTEPTGSRG